MSALFCHRKNPVVMTQSAFSPRRDEAHTGANWFDLVALALALSILGASAVLTVEPDQNIKLTGTDRNLPRMCSVKRMFGFDCPACGLTRSFIHLSRGDVSASFTANRVGILVALSVALQVPLRLFVLATNSRPRWTQMTIFTSNALPVLAILLIANWVLTMAGI